MIAASCHNLKLRVVSFQTDLLKAYSHYTGTVLGQVQGTGLMRPNLYRNVHTGPRQGKEPGSIVSARIRSRTGAYIFSLFTPGGPHLHPIILPLVPYPFCRWGSQ